MVRMFLLFINIVFSTTYNGCVIEARVYCQDSNAGPWKPLGFTCPVVCATILNAIERLIMMDYKKSVKEQLGEHPKVNKHIINYAKDSDDLSVNYKPTVYRKSLIDMKHNKESTDIDKNEIINTKQDDSNKLNFSNLLNQGNNSVNPHKNILKNVKFVKGILRRTGISLKNKPDNKNKTPDGKCWFLEKFKPKLLLGKVVRRKCTRRGNFDGKFVTIMTNVLNKYVDRVDTVLKFTDEMTEILLENIFGNSADMRNNILDVNKLLNYLRKSVDRHRIHSHNHVIKLTSRRCLTLSIPGCFCKAGYVENSGQCVRPEDCVTNDDYIQYLTRIIVL